MHWVFVITATIGVVLVTPLVFGALLESAETAQVAPVTPVAQEEPVARGEHRHEPTMAGFAGFSLLVGGLAGLATLGVTGLVAPALGVGTCIGIAIGAVHADLIDALGSRNESRAV